MYGGECPLSSVHMQVTEVGLVNRSGSGVTEEEILVYTHIVEGIYCGNFPCYIPPSGTE